MAGTAFLAAMCLFVDGRPGAAFGFFRGRAAIFIAFFDVFGPDTFACRCNWIYRHVA